MLAFGWLNIKMFVEVGKGGGYGCLRSSALSTAELLNHDCIDLWCKCAGRREEKFKHIETWGGENLTISLDFAL